MRKLLFLIALGIIGAGQVKADPTCVAGTLATYVSQGSCNFMGLDFSGFNTTHDVTFNVPGGTSNIELTPVSAPDGPGFTITPLNGVLTNVSNETEDAQVDFVVSCIGGSKCINDIFMSITGSATGTTAMGFTPGQDVLTEAYCLGGTYIPPTAPCAPSAGNPITDILTITPTSAGTMSLNPMFSPVSTLSISKDIGAVPNNGTATIVSVTDEFSTGAPPSVPEPSVLLMLGSGLVGLALFSVRRRRQGILNS